MPSPWRRGLPSARLDEGESASRSREVGRSHDSVALLEDRNDVAVAPNVVTRRQNVGAGGQELLGEFRGDAHAVRDVLSVDDAEIRTELVP